MVKAEIDGDYCISLRIPVTFHAKGWDTEYDDGTEFEYVYGTDDCEEELSWLKDKLKQLSEMGFQWFEKWIETNDIKRIEENN